jgi:hypothetical protein
VCHWKFTSAETGPFYRDAVEIVMGGRCKRAGTLTWKLSTNISILSVKVTPVLAALLNWSETEQEQLQNPGLEPLKEQGVTVRALTE